MIDLYLRASTESALKTALPQFVNGGWVTATPKYSLDLIGPVVTTEATYDANGNELTAPTWDTKYHANLRCTQDVADTITSSIIINPSPNSPSRKWSE